jgi:Pyruvate phosphate dikinase, AMP/ATP-binding domain/Lamin Tail Domain
MRISFLWALRQSATAGLVVAMSGCGAASSPASPDAAPPEPTTNGGDAGPLGRDAGGGGTTSQPPPDGGAERDAGPPATELDSGTEPTDPSSPEAGTTDPTPEAGVVLEPTLAFNEVMAKNGGAWIDEDGETDDWIELVNRTTTSVNLSDFTIEDSSGVRIALPELVLQTRQGVVLWPDGQLDQGTLHLPFKLDADLDSIVLRNGAGQVVDTLEWTELEENETLARFPNATGDWSVCRYATPRRGNGDTCAPPAPPEAVPEFEYGPYSFPTPFPAVTGPLGISELALRPSAGTAFVELINRTDASLALADFSLRLSPHGPGVPWPDAAAGELVPFEPDATLEPGARVAVTIADDSLAALQADEAFEGVITLFDAAGTAVERVDFMRWPLGTTLTRLPDGDGQFRFCYDASAGVENSCDPVLSREVGDRIRHLRTPGDFEALGSGETRVGMQSAKFVLDMEAGGVVHLLGSTRWPLHYTFVREQIYGQPALDRCDPEQAAEFHQGWVDFSRDEYFVVDGRRFLLGTLTHHGGTGLHAVEYAQGDVIVGEQMKLGFFSAVAHTQNPTEWVLHPQDPEQAERALEVDGQLPIVDPNAPYAGLTYQPLTEGLAYGTLRFVPAAQLKSVPLGPEVIVVTDDVPNDIPFVGGLITEAFQTPLAHVNVLSQNRGTPNAALKDARTVLAPYLEQLVKLEVKGVELLVELADPAEAQAFWDAQAPTGPPLSPRLDSSVRGVQPLADHGLDSLPIIGAKAAQLAELARVNIAHAGCVASSVPINTPRDPFAIPLVHSQEHFVNSGAWELLADLQTEPTFGTDPVARAESLALVRQLILDAPIEAMLLEEVKQTIVAQFSGARVRFRSSSNTEDLPGFNGAGLYTSTAVEIDTLGEADGVEDAIREIWASLWNARAYDERRHARIDDTDVAMGVLVQPAFPSEEANGVAMSRDLLDPSRGDIYYINVQAGEASVTNPAPSVTTEQLVYRWGRSPLIMYHSESSLLEGLRSPPATVLTPSEVTELACALGAVHDWFEPLLNADSADPWFTMEVEFKFIGEERALLLKQARPYSFPNLIDFGDCREL